MLIDWIMNEPSYRKATLSTVCLIALGAVAAAGCNKSEAAPKPGGRVESVVVAGAKAETENFVAEIKAIGAAAAGKAGAVEVILIPKSGYHTNAQ